MTEYIDREKALDIFGDVPMWQGYYESYPWEVHCAIVGIVKLVREEISKIPTSDVAPVVHGRWIHYPDCGVTRCSHCGWSIEECWESKRCPNCGAKMDSESDTQN